jgi:gliding motility-associated lipoprotein GldH
MVNKTMQIKVNKLIFGAMLVLVSLVACKKAPVYSDTHVFSDGIWGSGEMPEFQFDMQDSIGLYNMSFVLRLNDEYDYQNMWVLMHTVKPTGASSTDTINLQVIDPKGKWLGKKSGSSYTFTGVFAYKHRFEDIGKHIIRMEHAVMNPDLRGVLDMTLMVEHADE